MESQMVNEDFLKRKDTYNLKIGGLGGFNSKGKITARDSNGKCSNISINDPRLKTGELIHVMKGLVNVKDRKGKTLTVSTKDPRYLNGELISIITGKVNIKDKNNNTFRVDKNDPRIGKTLFYIWKNKKHSEETKAKIGKANSVHQIGKGNSQFGTMWITNENENRKVSKDLKRLPKGFRKGRKQNLNK